MFNSARLTLARQRRKLTKKALAEALAVHQKTIVRWESGRADPTEENIEAFSRVLRFPSGFFLSVSEIDTVKPDAVSFRALSAMPSRDRDSALASASFAFVLSDWVNDQFNLPPHDLLDFQEQTDPEAAAVMLREKWGLGVRPISNVVRLLEVKGVRVFSLTDNTDSLDGISMWRRNIPYIFISAAKTAERSRHSAAHELGHLCLHKHGGPRGRTAEDQANLFAASFLMPRSEVLARLPRVNALQQIVEGKKHWKVSVAALNYRLHKLGVTSEWQYKQFCIQIQKFRKSEPYGIPKETSTVWDQVFAALRNDGVSKPKLANTLNLPVTEIEDLIFGLTNMQSIEGNAISPSKSRARLSLVT